MEESMPKDIRWKQRFQNFERAFIFLSKSCQLETYDELQGAGLVQSFEFTFELAWKTLKDYLQDQGLEVQFPREVIKQAFATQLIEDGSLWIEMLDKRNELTHTYNQDQATRAVQKIRNHYFKPIEQVYQVLKKRCSA
jgi:nucleotidyltransferase substrate binding protein (TIGR01987 family)